MTNSPIFLPAMLLTACYFFLYIKENVWTRHTHYLREIRSLTSVKFVCIVCKIFFRKQQLASALSKHCLEVWLPPRDGSVTQGLLLQMTRLNTVMAALFSVERFPNYHLAVLISHLWHLQLTQRISDCVLMELTNVSQQKNNSFSMQSRLGMNVYAMLDIMAQK